MREYDFAVILAAPAQLTKEVENSLFEAGCADGMPWSSQGVVGIGFARKADSLESAIRSAIADVEKAGCAVAKVEIVPEALAPTS